MAVTNPAATRNIFTPGVIEFLEAQKALLGQRNLLDQFRAGLPATAAEDPAFRLFQAAQFRRALENTNAVELLRTQLQAQETTKLGELAREGEEGRRGVRGSFESRGLRRSSGVLGALARQREAEENRAAAIRQGTAQKIAAANQELASKQADIGLEQATRFGEAAANLARQRQELGLLRSQIRVDPKVERHLSRRR